MKHTLAALLRKNWIVKKRRPFATLSEVLNPLICILLFAALKAMEPDRIIPSGWTTTARNASAHSEGTRWNLFAKSNLFESFNETLSNSGISAASSTKNGSTAAITSSSMSALSLTAGLNIPMFYFTETTMAGLLLNLALQSVAEGDHLEELSDQDVMFCFMKFVMFGYTSLDADSFYSAPAECRNKIVPYKIAITPDTTYTRKYSSALMEKWYPRMSLVAPVMGVSALQMASFKDSRVFFDNETAFEQYIASEEYGLNLTHPKIYAAIALQEFPRESSDIGDIRGHNIEHSLRLNSTFTNTNFPGSVPRTIGHRFNVQRLQKEAEPLPTLCYATRGFITLQTTVSRFLNCLPSWDAASEAIGDTCQLAESTMVSNDDKLDTRLLKQLENDLIISSVLEALKVLREVVFASPSLSALLSNFIEPLKRLSLSVDGIPKSTKDKLLTSLRQAPQAFHGAGVYVSPIEGFQYAGFYDKILIVFPVGFVLSYLYGVSRVIVALVVEKETKSRELMRILGTNESQILFSWFLTYLQLLLTASLLQTIGAKALLFSRSDFGLLFAFFFTFALSSFGYGFLISSLFSRA
ncbi:Atp-binding protein, partial [Globisporangium splendens]